VALSCAVCLFEQLCFATDLQVRFPCIMLAAAVCSQHAKHEHTRVLYASPWFAELLLLALPAVRCCCCCCCCRCPAPRLSEFLDAGVTCVVGLLGTDDISRSNEELVIKVAESIPMIIGCKKCRLCRRDAPRIMYHPKHKLMLLASAKQHHSCCAHFGFCQNL
jgi:hypothetical protein